MLDAVVTNRGPLIATSAAIGVELLDPRLAVERLLLRTLAIDAFGPRRRLPFDGVRTLFASLLALFARVGLATALANRMEIRSLRMTGPFQVHDPKNAPS